MSTDRLKDVFRQALGLPPGLDPQGLAYQQIAEWDSLSHLTLVTRIEEAFGIMLETDDVIGMSSFAKALEIVAKYEGAAVA
jgi:acyl carrier protein